MSGKPWGGRFAGGQSELVEAYTGSVHFDKALYAVDIRGSKAHAAMLAAQGVISAEDARAIAQGLDQVLDEIESGRFEWKRELEDVHMNIERRLTEIIGEPGKRLHTGRSRNDQVALDMRQFVAARLAAWQAGLRGLVGVLAERAAEHAATLLPGLTHLQPAQPVSLGHHLLAYANMFRRDFDRAGDALDRTRVSPLGAAALAGTTYPLDPSLVAEELGFAGVFSNSMDAVSDRDFVVEALSCASLVMMHLSRLCEEIIIWANPRFGFVALPDAYATGSSIMPQKKNPDVAELMRGKTGRVYGSLVSILTLMKGLPLAYNRDMQEDKEPFFDADRTVSDSLALAAGMLAALEFRPDRMRQALSEGFVNATEMADWLVGQGVPFREAHHITGRAVALAESRGVGLEDLSLEELQGISPVLSQGVFEALDHQTAADRRSGHGGTGGESVARQLAAFKAWLG